MNTPVVQKMRHLLRQSREFIQSGREGARILRHRISKRSSRLSSSSQPIRKLIFHVGFRKTGTTSIQMLLLENASLLRHEVGVSTRVLEPSTDELRKAGAEWSRNDNPRNALKFEGAAIRFAEHLKKLPQNTVIISDENIIGHDLIVGSDDIFSISSRVLNRLEMALSEFEIHFVIYTRNRDAWFRSCYSQDVRWHRVSDTFEEWLEGQRSIRGWNEGYEVLCNNLRSKVTFISMEAELDGNGLLGRSLLEAAHLAPAIIAELEPSQPQNTSLTPVQLEFMRKINELGMSFRLTHMVADVVAANQDLFRK